MAKGRYISLKLKKDVIDKAIVKRQKQIQAALIYRLTAYVEELVNDAKLSGAYNDQTGNLRSSIGGVLLYNKQAITYEGFEEVAVGGTVGKNKGLEYLNSLIPTMRDGYVILLVAGMNYASYVEEIHNLNVLSLTEMKNARELPQIFKEVIDEI